MGEPDDETERGPSAREALLKLAAMLGPVAVFLGWLKVLTLIFPETDVYWLLVGFVTLPLAVFYAALLW